MHKALNVTLGGLPNDTKVFVCAKSHATDTSKKLTIVAARSRVHQVQCEVRRVGPPECGREVPSGICREQQGDPGQVYHRRREGKEKMTLYP